MEYFLFSASLILHDNHSSILRPSSKSHHPSSVCFLNTSEHTNLSFFLMFLKRVTDVKPPKLAAVFRIMKKEGELRMCWRSANISPVPKGLFLSLVEIACPIYITTVLSKVYAWIICPHLVIFSLNQTIFSRPGSEPVVIVLEQVTPFSMFRTSCMQHWKGELEQCSSDWLKWYIWRVYHFGFCFCWCCWITIHSQWLVILLNRKNCVVVDGGESVLVYVITCVHQDIVLAQLLFSPIHSRHVLIVGESTDGLRGWWE